MKCFITFLRCLEIVEGAFGSIYEPLLVHNVSFLPTTNLNIYATFEFSGNTFPAKGMWGGNRNLLVRLMVS